MRRSLMLAALFASSVGAAATDPRGLPAAWRHSDADADPSAWTVELHDVDGDGRQDLVLHAPPSTGAAPGRVVVARDAATWSGVAAEIVGADDSHPSRWSDAPGVFGDVDGDGAADQLTWRGDPLARDRTLQLRRGGAGGLDPASTITTVDDATVPWQHGDKVPVGPLLDANLDGYADALMRSVNVTAGDRSGQLSWHAGGAGGLSTASAWRTDLGGFGFVDARVAVIGDVDADLWRDLVHVSLTDIGDRIAADLTLTRGDADGFRDAWWASLALPVEASTLDAVQLLDGGDLGGDGYDDLLVLITPDEPTTPASLWVFEGDPNYGFKLNSPSRVWLASEPGPAALLGLGDLDADGAPDVAIGRPAAASASGGAGVIEVLYDVRTQAFDVALTFSAELGEARLGWRGAVGDVDADGRDDLVALLDVDGAPGVTLFFGFTDADLDGWDDAEDCRPNDPASHPGADETWYDGVDQDCDGNDDDQDEDGTPSPADCQDTDPAVTPDAAEVWYDGVDQDCDGNDDDQDGDGVARADDCDDADARRYPDAVDTPDDGVDQDCDGADATSDAPADDAPGCGCDTPRATPPLALVLLAAVARRRRR